MPTEKMRDAREEAVGGVAVSQKGNAGMDGKCAEKTKERKEERCAEIRRQLQKINEALELIEKRFQEDASLRESHVCRSFVNHLNEQLIERRKELERELREEGC